MALSSIIIGLFAAGLVVLQSLVLKWLPSLGLWSLLGMCGVVALVYRFSRTQLYNGLADLMLYIHSPGSRDLSYRWAIRGLVSAIMGALKAPVGPEGAAIEFAHAFEIRTRGRPALRFEQQRRTDVGTAIAAGVSAAFGSPFAAVLIPMELGIGGRTLSVVTGSLVAFLAVHFLSRAGLTLVKPFDLGGVLVNFRLVSWSAWLGVAVVAAIAGVFGTFAIRFIRYSNDRLVQLFKDQAWVRAFVCGALLLIVGMIHPSSYAAPSSLFEMILWSHYPLQEIGLLFAALFLSLVFVLSGFGSVGVFWPLLVLGAVFGVGINHWVLHDIPGFNAVAGLVGGVTFWAVILGAPIAGSVLVFELTGNVQVLVVCLLAGVTARFVRQFLRTPTLIEHDLRRRGLTLIGGRSASILDAILVKDAMVTDYEVVHEHEPITDLRSRLNQSRYPFLPVVTTQGVYTGLLTIDMVHEAWQSHQSSSQNNPSLVKLVEAKDLLYRTSYKPLTVKAEDRLSVTADLFGDTPCVPVLSDDSRVLGLLFVYNVRLAYDREVARRSFGFGSARSLEV